MAVGQQGSGDSRVVFMAEQRRQSGRGAGSARQRQGDGGGARAALGGGVGRTAAAERGKRRQRSKMVGRLDSASGGVSEWEMIKVGQWQCVGESEAAGCRWWQRGRSEKQGGGGGIVIF